MAVRRARQAGRWWLWALCLLALTPVRAHAERADDRIERADEAYRNSNYLEVQSILGGMEDVSAFPTKDQRIRGFRLLALSRFYLNHLIEAHDAFFALLKQDPYYELTLEPTAAIDFFKKVREQENANLEPIRLAIEADKRLEEQRQRMLADAQREADQRRYQAMQLQLPQVVERRVVQSQTLIALMPFGLGQFQNGKTKLGVAFAVSEGAAALTSCASWLVVELMRQSDGTFNSGDFPIAKRFDGAKWVSAGLFYALWLAGAIEANVNFVPQRVVEAPASAAPPSTPRPADNAPEVIVPERVTAPAPAPVMAAPPANPSVPPETRTPVEIKPPAPPRTETETSRPTIPDPKTGT